MRLPRSRPAVLAGATLLALSACSASGAERPSPAPPDKPVHIHSDDHHHAGDRAGDRAGDKN